MLEKNQSDLWPNWQKGSFVEGNKPLGEPEKTEKEKADERINGVIKDIYRKIDEAGERRRQREQTGQKTENSEADPNIEKLPAEKDEGSEPDLRDYKQRQYKD